MSEHRYALFLGCTVPIKGLNYELSARKVAERLGIELVDNEAFGCCGYPIASIHSDSATALAALGLAHAESMGLNVLTLCSACTGQLTKVQKKLSDPGHADELAAVNEGLKEFGLELKGTSTVKHFARVLLEDIGVDKVKEAVTEPLTGINIAPHYGCHCIRPSEIFDEFDDPICPDHLDKLIEVTGATSVQYKEKMQCCGGGILAFEEETPMKMVRQKLEHIKEAHADAMTLICPSCNVMYDEYQASVEDKFDTEFKLPVLFYSQLLGLAMGLDPKKDLAVKKNVVRVKPLLNKIAELRQGE
jgi:heterodisulfide reductase subunit B